MLLLPDDSQNVNRNASIFYREAGPGISSDSESSDRASECDESDYMTSYDEPPNRSMNNRDAIITEKLLALKLNLRQKDGPKDDSIVARSPGADDPEASIASIPESRFSSILAGRLEEVENAVGERSLLNIAMNESKEKYEDSLDDIGRVSKSNKIERDSLEPQTFARTANSENLDPNIQGNSNRRIGGVPRVVSNELVNIPIKIVPRKTDHETEEAACSNSVLKDKNDNIREVSRAATTMTDKYDSLMCEKERLITADIKMPNPARTRFIEDCFKSTPKSGKVNADTFGSELITDISDLSMLGETDKEPETCRKQILKRISHQFAENPTQFTEKLLTLVEESYRPHSKLDSSNVSGVNLSRLTEEFRKICRGYRKGIEDESMPEFSMGQSLLLSTPPVNGDLQNFSKLGGGKKIYRKTPRRVFAGTGNQCGTPNCKNVLHGANANVGSPGSQTPTADNDSTATFVFLENWCYEESPTKRSKSKSANAENSERGFLSNEGLILMSNAMASLDESVANTPGSRKEALPNDQENVSVTSSRECQDHSNSMRMKFLENLSSSSKNETDKSVDENVAEFNSKQKYFEVENTLVARLVEKRRKCFEEARKVFEPKENSIAEKMSKPLKTISESTDEADPRYDNFVNTLAACVEYYDHARTLQHHRNSLQCILECSEGPESLKESLDESVRLQYVETVVIPAVNRMETKDKKVVAVAAPKTPKLISQVSLYVPGSPGPSTSPKSPRSRSRRSAGRRLSPGGYAPSVVAKKIKSPVSPNANRNVRAVKPASHASVARTPMRSLVSTLSGGKQNSTKSSPGIQSLSHNKLKSSSNSPGLMDVTNIKKSGGLPKVVITNTSPFTVSQKESDGYNIREVDCQKQLQFSETETPKERQRRNKFFFTPDKTPTYGKVRPKKKYFQTPRQTPAKITMPGTSPSHPGSNRINYNTVQSPVGNYIRGTDPNFITNVRGKTNERMLTPKKTPGSGARAKAISPILARSPRLSPSSSESSRLKFQLNSQRRQHHNQDSDILNIALCEVR